MVRSNGVGGKPPVVIGTPGDEPLPPPPLLYFVPVAHIVKDERLWLFATTITLKGSLTELFEGPPPQQPKPVIGSET